MTKKFKPAMIPLAVVGLAILWSVLDYAKEALSTASMVTVAGVIFLGVLAIGGYYQFKTGKGESSRTAFVFAIVILCILGVIGFVLGPELTTRVLVTSRDAAKTAVEGVLDNELSLNPFSSDKPKVDRVLNTIEGSMNVLLKPGQTYTVKAPVNEKGTPYCIHAFKVGMPAATSHLGVSQTGHDDNIVEIGLAEGQTAGNINISWQRPGGDWGVSDVTGIRMECPDSGPSVVKPM